MSPGVTLSPSPSQTPPGLSPSAGAYLQLAVSFNHRCLALFTDTGYLWMGLATLKVSVPCCLHSAAVSPGRWGVRAGSLGVPVDPGPQVLPSGDPPLPSSPDFIPDSPLLVLLDPPFCWFGTSLSVQTPSRLTSHR